MRSILGCCGHQGRGGVCYCLVHPTRGLLGCSVACTLQMMGVGIDRVIVLSAIDTLMLTGRVRLFGALQRVQFPTAAGFTARSYSGTSHIGAS